MFYAHYVLNKKGPLARIWLAAHWDKKLTKANVFETNIEKSVEGILQPKVKLALRTSGHLMLGVVRIYSKKEKYLLADCNEAFVKIKMAFRPGMVDLPEEKREAAVNAITLPEVFHDFDSAMPELNDVDIQAQFSFNQSRAEEITMREDYGNISLVTGDDGFGDMGFDAEPPELMRDASSIDPSLENPGMLFDGAGAAPQKPDTSAASGGDSSAVRAASTGTGSGHMELDAPIRDDGFGGNLGQDIMAGGLFDGGLFDDAPIPEPTQPEPGSSTAAAGAATPGSPDRHSDDFGHYDAGSPMGGGHSSDGGSRAGSPMPGPSTAGDGDDLTTAANSAAEAAGADPAAVDGPDAAAAADADDEPVADTPAQDQTTLVHNEDETFALPPIDTSTLKGMTRSKRKRKLIVDEVKNISGEEMKNQLSDTSDIVTTLDLAPPTKRLMHWKETGGVEKLFALPARDISASSLSQMYARHLTSRPVEFDEFGEDQDEFGEQLLVQMRAEEEQPSHHLHEPPQPRNARKKRKRQAEPDPEPTPEELQHQQLQMQQLQLQQQLMQQQQEEMLQQQRLLLQQQMLQQQQQQQKQQQQVAALEASLDSAAVPPVVEPPPPPQQLDESVIQPPAPSQLPEDEPAPPATPAHEAGGDQLANMGYDETQPAPASVEPPPSMEAPPSVGGPATPWQPDEPQLPEQEALPEEEQLEGETDEQFEDRVNNRRAAAMHGAVRTKLHTAADTMMFSELCRRNNRKQVAQKFYTALVLKKLQVLHLEQSRSYAEIVMTQGPYFSSAQL